MSFPIAPAFSDTNVYQYRGSLQPRQDKFHLAHAIQPDYIQAFLVGKISKDFAIAQPLQITIEREDDGSYIVSDDIFLMYGVGDSRSIALNDYVSSLINYFQIVEKGAETNEFDEALLAQLKSYIQRRGNNAVQTIRN